MIKGLAITIMLLLGWCAHAQTKGDTLYVAAHSGLNLRTEPGSKANKLMAIPKEGMVVVLAGVDSAQAYAVTEFPGFQIKGFWVEVDYNGQVGFVFSGYLSGFKPFAKDKDWRGLVSNESAYQYLLHNFGNPKSINYYAIPDTCIMNWTTYFSHGISYEVSGACMDGGVGATSTIKFSNYSLQEVYLFFLLSRKWPCEPVWDKKNSGIRLDEDDIHDVIWHEDLIYPKGNKIIWESTGGC